MPRPRTQIGETAGTIKCNRQVQNSAGRWVAAQPDTKGGRWRARVKFRDEDGVLRDVERFASTKGRAVTKLKEAIRERQTPARGGVLHHGMTVSEAGEVWLGLADRADSGLSENTRRQYRSAFNRYVTGSTVQALTLREANKVPVLERYVQGIADRNGTGAAKTARSVLSGVLGLAVRYGALPHSAMRDVRPARASEARQSDRDTSRAFTVEELTNVLQVADASAEADHSDVADIVWWLAGTGVRISEALGQRWDDVDLQDGTVLVRGTKTKASTRRLVLPDWLRDRVEARAEATHARTGYVFPSPNLLDPSRPRDRRNVARVFRVVLNEAGCPWATPHTFRRTVATLLDAAGRPIAEAANQLGHANPAMTARVYLGRGGDLSGAASALSSLPVRGA